MKDPRDNGLNFQPREMQTSFDSKGRTHKTTQGEYCTAWFDHGTNQQGKSYEYSVQVLDHELYNPPQQNVPFVAREITIYLQLDFWPILVFYDWSIVEKLKAKN